MEISSIIFGIIIGFLIGFLIMKIESFRHEKWVRREAIRGSRSALTGEIYEKVLPALPNFPYAPKEMVFVGKGCDYIIFDGLSEGDLREVVFLELKSGKSRLNANEKAIRRTVDAKNVRFAEMRIGSVKNDE